MAKIANVQLPVNPVGNALPVQSAKDTQGSSDFLAMLLTRQKSQWKSLRRKSPRSNHRTMRRLWMA